MQDGGLPLIAMLSSQLYNVNIKTSRQERGEHMIASLFPVGGLIAGIITIVAGIIILVWPRVIAYIIGIYLIVIGLVAVIAVLR